MAIETRSSNTALSSESDCPSLWLQSTDQFSGQQILDSRETTDVVIVGAGVTGLSTALHLRERGYKCAVIEAGQPGDGATGRSGGLVAPDFVIDTVSSVGKRFGAREGERFARLIGSSAKTTFDLISEYNIQCQPQQHGFIVPGISEEVSELLAVRGSQWRSLGFPVTTLDEKETRKHIGTSVYRTALYFEQGGALNPLAYAIGLAETVYRMGVPVFVDSPVTTVKRMGKHWRVSTAEGSMDSNRVVLAANGGNLDLHPALRNTAVPMSVFEFATRPLTLEESARNMGGALPYTDRQPYMFTARVDHESRIISALPGLFTKRKLDVLVAEATARLRRFYPDLKDPSIEYIWQGIAYLNRDLLPAIYAPEDGLDLLAVQACNGRGIAVNTAIGREIASLIVSDDDSKLSVPITKPKKIPIYGVAKRTPAMLMTIARTKDRFSKQ